MSIFIKEKSSSKILKTKIVKLVYVKSLFLEGYYKKRRRRSPIRNNDITLYQELKFCVFI